MGAELQAANPELKGITTFVLRFSTTIQQFMKHLAAGESVGMLIIANQIQPEFAALVDAFYAKVGAFNDHIGVMSADPTPDFMASLYEYGIDYFVARETWLEDAQAIFDKIDQRLQDEKCSFFKSINLQKALVAKDKVDINVRVQSLIDESQYDFRAAMAIGKGYEAVGDLKKAISAFEQGKVLNRNYRPLLSDLGDALIADGQYDRGLMILKQLERTNPENTQRKAQLINAFVTKGDFVSAQAKVEELSIKKPGLQLINELQTHVYLASGQIEKALVAMDGMKNVGDEFAGKLNEHGIRFAKEGKGKSALMLYQKAHQIVRPDLKYKISLNGALACYRIKAFPTALKFIDRCEQEFGKPFPKSQKVKQMIVEAMNADAKKTAG